MPLLPALVVLLQVRQQILHEIRRPDGPDVSPRSRRPARCCSSVAAPRCPEPVAGVVPRVSRVAQPSDLVELMPGRATDRPVGSGPERPVDELGERVAAVRRAVGQVLGDQLPAVVVGRVDLRVGALEERDVRLVPVPVAVVPERLRIERLLLVDNLRRAREGTEQQEHAGPQQSAGCDSDG